MKIRVSPPRSTIEERSSILAKLGLVLQSLLLAQAAYAMPELALPATTQATPGSIATLRVYLSRGDQEYAGTNLHLNLPSGFRLLAAEPTPALEPGAIGDSFQRPGSAECRALVYSRSGSTIGIGDAILKLLVAVPVETPPGVYDVTFVSGDSALAARFGTSTQNHVTRDGSIVVLDSTDSDNDGIPDVWEIEKLGTLDYGPNDDSDGDLLLNTLEFELGTDPLTPDSDGDGVIDGIEVSTGTDPNDSGSFPILHSLRVPFFIQER